MKNRRDFLKLSGFAGFGAMGAAVIPAVAISQAPSREPAKTLQQDAPSLPPMNRFPRMVQNYFTRRLKHIELTSQEKRDKLLTRSDAEAYVQEVRSKIRKGFDPWPEKTPLNVRVTGILNRKSYRVEKIIFESRPEFYVTANVYIPLGRNFPLPAVLGTVGHGKYSKAHDDEQSFAQGLVSKGYVVMTFDPIGQGERIQLLTADLQPRHGVGTAEHTYTGNPLLLTGESLSSWFAWDGIRALDYLLSRKEVDKNHVGVTGYSGGGMQATYLCALDSRLTMAAPCCWVTTWLRNLENEEPADVEQCPPHLLGMGIDQSDFIAAMAPRPVILLTQEKDFFDTRGTQEAFARLKHLYKLLEAEDNIQLFRGPEYHSYSRENRVAMYAFFNSFTKISSVDSEPVVTLEKAEDLWCTGRGQVGELSSRTVFSHMLERSMFLKKNRGTPGGENLKKAIADLLKLSMPSGEPRFRILRTGPKRFYSKNFAATYLSETEQDVFATVYRLSDTDLFSRPPVGLRKAVLYISHLSADDELRTEPLLSKLINEEPDSAIFTCDVRGIGESMPNTTGQDFFAIHGSDYMYAVQGVMLDSPYVGQKTNDVLSVIRLLQSYGHEEIHLVAKGWGTIPATFAALLSGAISRVTLKNALISYSAIVESEKYDWPLSSFLPGVLKTFDLPDCYRELASKNLRMISPWGAMGADNI